MPRYSSVHGFDEPVINLPGIVRFLLVVAVLAGLAFISVAWVCSHRSIGNVQSPESQTVAPVAPAPPMRTLPSL